MNQPPSIYLVAGDDSVSFLGREAGALVVARVAVHGQHATALGGGRLSETVEHGRRGASQLERRRAVMAVVFFDAAAFSISSFDVIVFRSTSCISSICRHVVCQHLEPFNK